LATLFYILILIATSTIVSIWLVPKIIAFSDKFSITEKKGKRKRHENEVSNMGGLIIYLAFIVSYFVFQKYNGGIAYFYLPFAVSILFLVGIYDDLKPLNASKKFFFQFLSVGIVVFLAEIHPGVFFEYFNLNIWIVKFITLVAIVYVINAYNLVDGINGLSASLALIAILGFSIWFALVEDFLWAFIGFCVIGSIIGFLRFNLIKTKIFLGDNGSMVLGLLVAVIGIKLIQVNAQLSFVDPFRLTAPIGIVVAAMTIPIFDTTRLFFLRPFYLQKSPFKADRNHLHHLLLRLTLSHTQSTLIISIVAAVLLIVSFLFQSFGNTSVIALVFVVCAALLIAIDYFIFNFYRKGFRKKTVFNEALIIQGELGNPVVVEFFFGLSFFLLAIAIPFHRVSTSIPTLIIALSFFLLLVRRFWVFKSEFAALFYVEAKSFFNSTYTKISLAFLLIYLANDLYFQSKGGNSISLKLLIPFYWLAFFYLEKIIRIKPRYLTIAYVYGCFGFIFFILYHAFHQFPKLGWNAFFYTDLLSFVKGNPITHSLLFNLAIIFLASNYTRLKYSLWKLTSWLMLCFFIVMVILFGSKIGYLVLFITVFYALNKFIVNLKFRIISFAVVISFMVLLYYNSDNFHQHIRSFVWKVEKHEKLKIERKLPRTVIWPIAVETIKQNWMFGVGVGNTTDILVENYENINYQKGQEHRFNAHNQFLETFMQTGILGFLVLIGFFLYGFYKAIVHRNKLYAVFLVIVLFYMMIESLFETQMGMVGFAFFNALFLSALSQNKDKKSTT
jgi:UDP-GlcNAc:undecaprenyl-phosphate/decaprenyl-phosphate GlcNAc-1-phosphate transferase